MLKFSVIIPCYNSVDTIESCLISALSQTYLPYEIILIDDCSSDNTVKIADELLSKHSVKYKIIQKENNSGPGVSRNLGIKKASGDYIVFLDSDDWYELNFLDSAREVLEATSSDIVLTAYQKVYDTGKVVKVLLHENLINESDPRNILAHSFDSLCTMVTKSDLLKQIKLPNLYNGEDVAVVPLIISKAAKIGYLNQVTYNYFQRSSSLSQKPTLKVAGSLLDSFAIIKKNLQPEFPAEVEFLGIKIVLYGAILNAAKAGLTKRDIFKIIEDFSKDYPNWGENIYMQNLNISKTLFLKAVAYKNYCALSLLSKLHSILSK